MGSTGRGITTHMVKYIYTVLIPSNLITLICVYLENSQLLEHKENIQILKKCILTLKEESTFLGGEKFFEKS
jgi:hypothetical protein